MGQDYRDIAYNAVVCGHGQVFEARWFNDRSGANGNAAGNDRYFAVCFLGKNPRPTYERARALRFIRRQLRKRAPQARRVRPHSDFVPTACPGDPMREWIELGGPLVRCGPLRKREKALQARLERVREKLRLGRCRP